MVRRHLAARKGARFDKWHGAQPMGVEEKGDNPSGKTRPRLSGNIPASVSRDLPSGNAFPACLRMGPLGRGLSVSASTDEQDSSEQQKVMGQFAL